MTTSDRTGAIKTGVRKRTSDGVELRSDLRDVFGVSNVITVAAVSCNR